MGRRIVAAIVGVIVAVACVALADMAGHALFPPPADSPLNDFEAFANMPKAEQKAAIDALPTLLKASLVGGWILATFAGALVAALIARAMRPAIIVGVAILAASIANLLAFPHPVGMWIAAILGIVPAAMLAGWLVARRATAAT